MEKGKAWYGFYATMIILIIAGFIVFAPLIKKSITDFENSKDDTNSKIDFCVEKIDLKLNDTLIFGDNLVDISTDMSFDDVKFTISSAEETTELEKNEKSNYIFTPLSIGEYELVATCKNLSSKLKINVSADNKKILKYNLGEVFKFENPDDETIVDIGENLREQDDGFIGEVAGLSYIYTKKDVDFYSLISCSKVIINPKVVITEGENQFEVVGGTATMTVKKQMAIYLYVDVYKEENTRPGAPTSIKVITNDEIDCSMFRSPDWEISLLNPNINEIRMILNYTIDGCADYVFSINLNIILN